MKIVKLDNRHNAFKEGYTCALRFDEWNAPLHNLEKKIEGLFGHPAMCIGNSKLWYPKFGKIIDPVTNVRPYWIYFRNESDLTFLTLTLTIK